MLLLRRLGFSVAVLALTPCFGFAQSTDDPATEQTDGVAEDNPAEQVGDTTDRRRRRQTPSGLYSDPASFFRVHGYATLRYGGVQSGLGTRPERAAQILLSQPSPETGQNEGGFRSDAALFIAAEPFEGLSTTIELHFVGDGLNPVLTEAKLTYDLLRVQPGRAVTARIHAGRYWWAFGTHDREWFSAVNRFPLVSPVASEVVPAHYNEVGLMLEGEALLTSTFGLNLALSIGNGVPGFTVGDAVARTPFDFDGQLSTSGRLAAYWNGAALIEVGFSGAFGSLRDVDAPDLTSTATLTPGQAPIYQFPSSFWAAGVDVAVRAAGFILDGYVYLSTESIDGSPVEELSRFGFNFEVGYEFTTGWDVIKSIALIARVSQATEEELFICGEPNPTPGTEISFVTECADVAARVDRRKFSWQQFGGVIIVKVTNTLKWRVAYVAQLEGEQAPDVNNDVWSTSLTAEF